MTSIYSSLLWKYRALRRGLCFQLHHSCFSLSKKARRYSRMEEGMKTEGQEQWSVEERSLKAGTWTRHFHLFPFRQYLVIQLWWVASEIGKLTLYYGVGMLCTQVKSDDFGKKRMNLGPPLEDPAAKTKEAAFSGELMYGHPQKRIPNILSIRSLFLMSFPNKRKQGSLEKWLTLGLGQETVKMNWHLW